MVTKITGNSLFSSLIQLTRLLHLTKICHQTPLAVCVGNPLVTGEFP